jgi:urease accessory protein
VDHLAAMLAVGLWSAQGETRRQIAWPLAFVAAMLVGGTLGRSGVAVPFAEPVIAASLLIFGMLVLFALRAPISAGALLVAAFAMAHGYAHGVEAPAAGWMAFAMGFTIATVLIHAVGIGIGRASAALGGVTTLRALGLVPVAVGVATLLR